jgi:hypothetical protein
MPQRNKFVAAIFVPLLIGSIGLGTLMRSTRFEAYRSVDVLQLIASGMCFGVALVSLIMMLRGSRAQ